MRAGAVALLLLCGAALAGAYPGPASRMASPPRVSAVTAVRLPADPPSADPWADGRVEVCWELAPGPAPAAARVLAGGEDDATGDFGALAEVPAGQRCWRGPWQRDRVWAVAALDADGVESERVLARGTPLRALGRLPVEAWLQGDTVTAIAEGGGSLWFATDGGGLSAAKPSEVGRAGSLPWTTWRRDEGPGADTLHDVRVEGRVVWAAADGQLARLDLDEGTWRVHGAADGLPSGALGPFAHDAAGALLVGAPGGDVLRFDAGSWQVLVAGTPGAAEADRLLDAGPDGRLWFSTREGLRVFDPARPRGEAWGPPERPERATRMAADRQGGLWFATVDQGLLRRDASGAWTSWRAGDGLADDRLHDLWLGEDEVLVATERGLARLQPSTGSWVPPGAEAQRAVDALAGLPLLAVHRDAEGALWAAIRHEGLRRVDADGGVWDARPAGVLRPGPVDALVSTRGQLWFVSEGGLARLTLATGAWTWWRSLGAGLGPPRTLAVAGAEQALWAGARGGVARYLSATNRWDAFDLPDTGREVLSLLPEGASVLVGTDRGLLRLELASGAWEPLFPGGRLEGARVQALMRDSAGALWIGTPDGALRLTTAGGLETRPAGGVLAGLDVTAVEEDGGGAVWFATRQGEAVQYLPANGEVRRHANPDGGAILGMVRDYGRLWFATARGLATWASATREGPLETRLVARGPRGVAVDQNGRVWLATAQGALRWDPETGASRRYDAALVEREEASRVLALAPAGADRVWLGTASGAALLVDRDGVVRERLQVADGLPTDPIRAMLRDGAGTLWLGTWGSGVVGVRQPEDPARREIFVLDGEAGPGSDRVTALFSGERGQLCATTEAGAACLDPSRGWAALKVPKGLGGAVLSMFWGREGRLWLGTAEGMGWRTQSGADRQALVGGRGAPRDAVAGARVIWEDQTGELWVALERGGLARLDRERQTLRVTSVDPEGTPLAVRGIAEAAGRIWLATDRGVWSRAAPRAPALGAKALGQQEAQTVAEVPEPEPRWERADALDLGPGTADAHAVAGDGALGLWVASSGGALRLDLESGAALRVDPSADGPSAAPLLAEDPVGTPLLGAAALVVGGALLGEPTSPSRVAALASACGERDLLLESGDVLRLVGEAGSREIVSAPLDEPRAIAVVCDEGSFNRSSLLCVGGDGLYCRAMAGQWAEVPLAEDRGSVAVTALMAGAGGVLWVGYEDGTVCHGPLTLAAGGRPPSCWREGLPAGEVRAIVEDGAGGVWVGSSAGLGRVRLDEQGRLAPAEPPRALRAQNDASATPGAVADLAGAGVRALAYDAAASTLWMALEGRGIVRVGPPARRSFLRKPTPAVIVLDAAPSLGRAGDVTALAVDGAHRLWAVQDGRLYDVDARPPPTSSMWMLVVALTGGLFIGIAAWGRISYSAAVRGWRRDPASVERIPLDDLVSALRVLRIYAPGFARASIGPARLKALIRVARAWRGPAEALLPAAAEAMGLEPDGEVRDGALSVHLSLGLALKRKDTLLIVLPTEGDPDQALRDRLEARAFHELVPALVIWPGEEPPVLHGAVSLSEADLRSVAWSRQPRRRLAGLIWQRSDMQGLSPYQAHGAVQDPRMFYGRDAVLRELTATGRRRALLVIGPRRVGKTSVLLRAVTELERRGGRTIYVTLRATVAGPYDLAVALARAARLPLPEPPAEEGPGAEAALLGAFVRANLNGANLLIDEADAFLKNDRARGSPASEELRALVQEGVCALALAGYGTLYRAALSQAETAYNLGEPLFLGSLDPESALRLATEPMERMGIRWVSVELAERLVAELGCLPHLIQEACRRLLLRVRGFREPELNTADLQAVLGDWRPEGEPSSLRELLITNIETNLKGPAQAAVWLLSDEEAAGFTLAELDQALRGAGFVELDSDRVLEVGLALQVAGVCQRGADRYRFLVPLLGAAVAHLDVGYRVAGLRDAWKGLDPAQRRSLRFWGGADGEQGP